MKLRKGTGEIPALGRRAATDRQTRGFKALKQSTKLLFLTLHRPAEALVTYTQLLSYTKSAVTRNYSEKTINGILDYVGGGKGGPVEVTVLQKFYESTMQALVEAKNDVFLSCYDSFVVLTTSFSGFLLKLI